MADKQKTLFDEEPRITTRDLPAHRDDPQSSFQAAKRINLDGARHNQKAAVLRAVVRFGGHTSRELAVLADLDRHLVARRLPDLESDQLVTRGATRVCKESSKGLSAVTWWATAAGISALQGERG